MKYYLILACISFFTLTNCSIGEVDTSEPQVIRVLWHLKNVSGGIAGVDNDFNNGVIIWEFKSETSSVTVTNTNSDTAIEDGLDSGTYTYSIEEVNNQEYLTIGSNELGSISVTSNGNQLIIDQNETSTGPAADGYIYTFDKSIIFDN